MVDFQSRDTRRGTTEEDEDEAGTEGDGAEETAPVDEPGDVTDESEPSEPREDHDVVAVLATSAASTAASDAAADELEAEGYAVCGRDQRARELDAIQSAVDEFVDSGDVCAIVTVGGTGVSPEDRTVEAVRPLLNKALPGFGETFRRQWGNAAGETALGSRATAGIADDTPVFCLPADAEAVTYAAQELVGPLAITLHREATGI